MKNHIVTPEQYQEYQELKARVVETLRVIEILKDQLKSANCYWCVNGIMQSPPDSEVVECEWCKKRKEILDGEI